VNERTTAPYGSWRSPITSPLVAASGVSLRELEVVENDLYWIEGRPLEGGRNVIMRRCADGRLVEVTPQGFNVRTRVHEDQGGGDYCVHGSSVYFANWDDQRLYHHNVDGDQQPQPITPEPDTPAGARYADLSITPDGRLIICVCELHADLGRDAVTEIVAVPADGLTEPRVLVSGSDFYAYPRLSPDGRRLAWMTWNYPQMPWDGSELWVADLTPDATVSGARKVAGGTDEAIFQPAWSPQGILHFISDRTGWWNLYRERSGVVEALAPMEAEFGQALWCLNQSTFAFLGDGSIACVFEQSGIGHIGLLRPGQQHMDDLHVPETAFGYRSYLRSDGQRLFYLGSSASDFTCLVAFDPATGGREVLRRSRERSIDPAYLSMPEAIEFPTDGGLSAHAFYYRPVNRDYMAVSGERPPLIVANHGGPTGATSPALNLSTQFWTSRGFAVVDVNYGGSTGYGRAYRQRLNSQWGVVNLADCANVARFLVDRDEVDGQRIAIHGGSAGGYTALCALVFSDLFAACAAHYGISDLETWAKETYKFEAHMADILVGPYPETRDRYRARSPIYFVDHASCPAIILQGLEDRICPASQAENMVAALRAKGVPVAYVPFAGEQHGYRRAENIQRALDAELYFYGRIFGFQPVDHVEPVIIENL
jgi:dienelactone hydrolase